MESTQVYVLCVDLRQQIALSYCSLWSVLFAFSPGMTSPVLGSME
jgi:hypothetical protein